ncbi:hypothetical protein RchiOBHm_Chr2g0113071 [Rosa chinensis]|uniref:Uncharacterized protein n=1 Tax=Rosa chinensis TaxID=74649 RepID=A0A2P6RQC4_ROSCH|nr:hypothetical protein RchiOBHm_Chr2g0113071 [Rosa chinensis]
MEGGQHSKMHCSSIHQEFFPFVVVKSKNHVNLGSEASIDQDIIWPTK